MAALAGAGSCAFGCNWILDNGSASLGADAGARPGHDGPDGKSTDCASGNCQPVKVASIAGGTEIALGSGGVVVTAHALGGVFYVPIAPDGSFTPDRMVRIADRGTPGASGPSTDGTSVCWAQEGEGKVLCSSVDGSALRTIPGGSGAQPRSTSIRGPHVYWVDLNDGWLRRADLADGGHVTVISSRKNGKGYALAQDGDRFLWILQSGSLEAAPLSGSDGAGTVATFSSNGLFADVAVTPHAYYIAINDVSPRQSGGIFRAPKDLQGGAATRIVPQTLLAFPGAAADGENVYFAAPGENHVWRLPLNAAVPDGGLTPGAPGGPVDVAGFQKGASSVRVDERFIYWINNPEDGALMRMAK